MYRMAVMALLIPDGHNVAGQSKSSSQVEVAVDKTKCIKMALVHDLAESMVGGTQETRCCRFFLDGIVFNLWWFALDLTPHGGVTKEEKHKRELHAMDTIRSLVSEHSEDVASEIHDLFMEYEYHETAESILVHDFDKFEMVAQAYEYEKDHQKPLDSFFQSTDGIFRTKLVQEWDAELRKNRKRPAGQQAEVRTVNEN
jgi:putative hydrolase of HD superfamily